LPAAVRIDVTNSYGWDAGRPVVNVGLYVAALDEPGATLPVRCIDAGFGPGIVLTGPDGVASCDLIVGDEVGLRYFRIIVGGNYFYGPYHVQIDP
jgi:hypothetical protein